MKDLARKAASKARANGTATAAAKAHAGSGALERALAEIPLRETGSDEEFNRDMVEPVQQIGKNVNFEETRLRSGSTTQLLSRTNMGPSAMSMRPGL